MDETFAGWLGLSEEDRSELDYWLLLARLQGPPAQVCRAVERFGGAQGVFEASAQEMLELLGMRPSTIRRLVRVENRCDLAAERRAFAESGARLVTILDADYPPRLRDLPDKPPLLFVLGDASALARDSVAIVGSRRASETAAADAETLAARLALAGLSVVSGFAVGIDAAAHRGALKHGVTVAVLGCGVDVEYPKAHRHLRQQIVASGTLVSELPLGATPRAFTFPARNRIIAGLALATVVIGAAEKSGALLTADAARALGRPLGAVPADARDPRHKGGLRLLGCGAQLVSSAEDVLAMIGRRVEAAGASAAPPRPRPSLSPDESAVLAALGWQPEGPDAVADRSGLDASRVATALLLLEVKGLARRCDGGRYTREE